MRERNDGTGESNILQNQFTAYLIIAVRRRKKKYLRSKTQRLSYELLFEPNDDTLPFLTDPDLMLGLPILDQIENTRLRQSLERARARDLYIFLAKALGGRSLAEIAAELGIGYNTAASVYYRLINRLKKELGGDDE
jgi:RNA polymerase sigma factor (sigma-70 family)